MERNLSRRRTCRKMQRTDPLPPSPLSLSGVVMGQVVLRVLEVNGLRDSGLTANDPIADIPTCCNYVTMTRAFRSRSIGAIIVALALTGCSDEPEVTTVVASPDGAIVFNVLKSDLGACCASLVRITGTVFGDEPEQLAEIEGSSDIRYTWTDASTLSIVACNATEVTFRSSFQNEDYTRRFILSVENERPREDGDRVLCTSDRFSRMLPL